MSGWADFDLPAGEKCSWWRLDGYDTCGPEAEESDADPQAPLDEEMGVDSEEEGHRGGATTYLGTYLATYARLLDKGLPSLAGLPGALPGLLGTLPGLPGPYLAYLALT